MLKHEERLRFSGGPTRFDERVPQLLSTPAAVRFLSCEPLLGPVDLFRLPCDGCDVDALNGVKYAGGAFASSPRVDWVIAGGESGPGARRMRAHWARDLRDQCAVSGVSFFFKQWGGFRPSQGGRTLDGQEWDEFPQPKPRMMLAAE